MPVPDDSVTFSRVFSRWVPLALSWSLMSFELPLVQSIVSSLPDSQINLAALGIVCAICLMCESPILMLVSAAAALVKDWESFRKLRIFALSLSFFMSAVFGIVTLGLDYSGVLLKVSNNDPILAQKVFEACLFSLVIPFVVGNRRFIQGVLIRSGKSILLTLGTLTRLTLIVSVGYILSRYSSMHGALIGASAGVAGMVGESVMITILSHNARRSLKSGEQDKQVLTHAAIFKFYSPLAISGVVNLSILPVLTFFMSQSIEPVRSLAGYQVLQGVIFFLSALALGLQEVVVSMLGEDHRGYKVLRNFTLLLALFVGVVFSIYVLTPLSSYVFIRLVGIAQSLFLFLHPVMLLAVPIPVITVFSVAMRGAVVVARKTRWITAASLAELIVVLVVMRSLLEWSPLSGLWNAVISLFCARLASCMLLTRVFAELRIERLRAKQV